MFRQVHILDTKNDNLSKTRDLLLPKLISGELALEESESNTLAHSV
jgi:type I restriction enzyme S subunit